MVDEKTKALAEQIVQYETQDKGFWGKLFAFEARDGFWSKLVKVSTNILAPIVFGGTAFMFASTGMGAGIAVASLAAGGAAIAGGALARSSTNEVLSQMHDSQKSGLSQFGHYVSTRLLSNGFGLGIIAAVMAVNGVPMEDFSAVYDKVISPDSFSSLAHLTLGVTMPVIMSSLVSGVFGDHQLMRQSENARGLAEVAISKGQSVEQALGQTVSQVLAPQHGHVAAAPQQNYKNSVTPDEYREMQARMQQGAPAHEQRHAERAITTAQSHEPVVAG